MTSGASTDQCARAMLAPTSDSQRGAASESKEFSNKEKLCDSS